MRLFFRFARFSDASALRAISEETFRAAYAEFNTEEDMDSYCSEHFSSGNLQREISDPGLKFLLAVEDGEILGYAKLNLLPGKKPGAENPLEIARLYTRVDLIGKGIGKMLVNEAVHFARENNFDSVCVDAWQKNTKAVKFYEREKFVITGTTQFVLGKDVQDDFVMVRSLV
jgi:GNAT superfamily N-acetyltransferase